MFGLRRLANGEGYWGRANSGEATLGSSSTPSKSALTGRPGTLTKSFLLPPPALWILVIDETLSSPNDASADDHRLLYNSRIITGKRGDVVRYILDRTIGRHKSQSDVHIPATCRRTVTTVIRAQQLRDFADPPYGFSMLTTSAARTAIRPCRTVLLPLRSTGRMSWLHSAVAMVRSAALKANRNLHAARLRCSRRLIDIVPCPQ
jgi:hypothetical protein